MKRLQVVCVLALLTAAAGGAVATPALVTKYDGLPPTANSENSQSSWMGNSGKLLGYTAIYGFDPYTHLSYPGVTHSFLADSSTTAVDIGVIGSDPPPFVFPRPQTFAARVNTNDQVCGEAEVLVDNGSGGMTFVRRAFFELPVDALGLRAGIYELPMLGTTDISAKANGLNDLGVIVGENRRSGGLAAPTRPVFWTIDQMTGTFSIQDLGPGSAANGQLFDVNNLGQMVGRYYALGGTPDGFVYLPSAAYGLPAGINYLSDANYYFTNPADINESGVIVGEAQLVNSMGAPYSCPAMWSPSSGFTVFDWKVNPIFGVEVIAGIGPKARMTGASFSSINDSGTAVGIAHFVWRVEFPFERDITDLRAFVFENGKFTLLDELKPVNSVWQKIFGNVSINNNGDIAATATNVLGETWAVKVTRDAGTPCPNGFRSQLFDQTFCSNKSAYMAVWASDGGADPLTYAWKHNGVPVSDGPTAWGSVISGSSSAVLHFDNVQVDDGGEYTVTISNSCGTSTSNPAYLNVFSGVLIQNQPANTGSCPQGPAVFSTTVLNTYLYVWQVEDPYNPGFWSDIYSSPAYAGSASFHVSGNFTNTLTITNFHGPTSPSLQFRCRLADDCGDQFTETAKLTICPADFNCNHNIEVADIFAFLNAWFAQFNVCSGINACTADINNNGTVEVADIFAFLNAWFAQFGLPCS